MFISLARNIKMKKITLLIFFMLLFISLTSFNYSKYNLDFIPKNKTVNYKTLEGLNTKYLLVEFENGYAIYNEITGDFIEGSYSESSPYLNYNKDLLYYGIGNYYVGENNQIKKLEPISTEQTNNIKNSIVSLENEINGKTYVDEFGYTMIKDSYFFENMKNFPINDDGTCGLVALSILLTYYDTFYNDSFINDELTYLDANGNSISVLNRIKLDYNYLYNFDYKTSDLMPEPTQAMKNYLFDKCLKILFGIDFIYDLVDRGYPMTSSHVRKSLIEYLYINAPELVNTFKINEGQFIYTHSTPKDLINNGQPVLITIMDYSTSEVPLSLNNSIDTLSTAHNVIAYGYKNDIFVAHFGWNSGNDAKTKLYIGKTVIQSYFSIDYEGEHLHSNNFYMIDKYTNEEVALCGCGHIENMHYHDYKYEVLNANYHNAMCLSCNNQFKEIHKFVSNRYNMSCKECGYVKVKTGDYEEIIFR